MEFHPIGQIPKKITTTHRIHGAGIFTNICPKITQMWVNILYMDPMG